MRPARCTEDLLKHSAACTYAFDATSLGLRINLATGVLGNTFKSCTLFYADGAFVSSDTCFISKRALPTVVELDAKLVRSRRLLPRSARAGALAWRTGGRLAPRRRPSGRRGAGARGVFFLALGCRKWGEKP